MNVSVDTSLVLALVKRELRAGEMERATALLTGATSLELSMVAYEELCRGDRVGLQHPELALEAADIAEFREASVTRDFTRQRGAWLASAWAIAREKGATSTTTDTLIARDAWLSGCVLATCDKPQAQYAERAFGPGAAQCFEGQSSKDRTK